MTRNEQQMKISILKGGILPDLESPMAWKMLTGLEMSQPDSLSVYLCKKKW